MAHGVRRTEVWPSGGDRVRRSPAASTRPGPLAWATTPPTSVTDPYGRVHGHDNLWVMDGSVHVTNGGFNPVLTILALAFRSAEHLAAR